VAAGFRVYQGVTSWDSIGAQCQENINSRPKTRNRLPAETAIRTLQNQGSSPFMLRLWDGCEVFHKILFSGFASERIE
jgi:hypothetical protein